MIDRHALLEDLKPVLRSLEEDLRERSEEAPAIRGRLEKEYEEARQGGRVGVSYEEWRADLITQVAVAWVLSSVFVRFLEDNALVHPPRVAGPLHGAGLDRGLNRARDERNMWFAARGAEATDRDYLLSVFDDLVKLPGCREVFGPHNAVQAYRDWLSGDAAKSLMEFFQKVDPDTGEVVHDFTDAAWDTRFLGDLYQDLSETARKKYALLQTPVFVEEFILDRTLEPAIAEFGLDVAGGFKMIDPACGSGHFLLGAFSRVLGHLRKSAPGMNERDAVNRALASIHGVDLNPYAVAIARFRLLLAAMREVGALKLADAPAFVFNLACGDSLLHGDRPTSSGLQLGLDPDDAVSKHVYATEDRDLLIRFLRHGQYHAVVGNPPYITPKDPLQNANIRSRYPNSCHMKYALSVPFLERIFDLAVEGGFTGQITANTFMKREFGKKLVERLIPQFDITHVIDTAAAHIPGHGTPTVILLGRNRRPVAESLRAVLGVSGVPSSPEVWKSIVGLVDRPGHQDRFVSVSNSPRSSFHRHPWSIGGGGAAELKEKLEQGAARFESQIEEAGFFGITAADDAMLADHGSFRRKRVAADAIRPLVLGDEVRDWRANPINNVLFPYTTQSLLPMRTGSGMYYWLWPRRAELLGRPTFGGKTYREEGRTWWEWHQVTLHRIRTPLTIVFGFVATHNHFVLDRGGKVFNRSAPVLKLPADATEDDHLGLVGLLNSSTACFYLKQVAHNKGSTVDQHGARQRTAPFEDFYEFTSGQLEKFPLPAECPTQLAGQLDQIASSLSHAAPETLASQNILTAETLSEARSQTSRLRCQLIALQEELDWQTYHLYGLLSDDEAAGVLSDSAQWAGVELGQRAFEIVLARKMAGGEEQTTWFERHGSKPTSEIPEHWPADYREVVQRRIELIESKPEISLIERPEYKRRWSTQPWKERQSAALRSWLLDRLESYFDFDGRMNDGAKPTVRLPDGGKGLVSTAALADVARRDAEFMSVAALYTDGVVDIERLVAELVSGEAVPLLPVLRYKPSGLDKRRAWERTWELQREEDRLQAQIDSTDDPKEKARLKAQMPSIAVPPKYTGADFKSGDYWRLRGKLDVPKERWVSFPHCEAEDGALVIAWAGLDHLQLARAIAARFEEDREQRGRRLVPLLAGIAELLPWLKQWHNDIDPEFGERMGDVMESYLADEAKASGMTVEQVKAWTPPEKTKKGKGGGARKPGGRKRKVEGSEDSEGTEE